MSRRINDFKGQGRMASPRDAFCMLQVKSPRATIFGIVLNTLDFWHHPGAGRVRLDQDICGVYSGD